jgi:hypothetical protein
MEFHIWDLERVNVKLNLYFIRLILEKLDKKFKTRQKAWVEIFKDKSIPFTTFKNILKESYSKDFFVQLDIYLKIIENIGISKEELEKNIISYKTSGGINFVENPILPIKINPVFDMILAHNIGDGTVINPKKGRLPYFGYRQFDEFYRVAYVRKLEFIFGKIKYKEDYFLKTTRPYCPASLSSLFFKYYNLKIEDFLSDRARIPPVVFGNRERILAFLIGMIIDEGHIDSTQIVINLKNKLLIEDLSKICDILEYKSRITQIKSEEEKGYWRIHILRVGMTKLWQDYLKLSKTYPIINLGWKGERIDKSFQIINRKIKNILGNQEEILKILKNEKLSVNQLADRISMTRQGVRYHIHNLINMGKIKIINKDELNWIYGV